MRAELRDAVYGAAVGDALGVPYEFKRRGTFTCEGMSGYGTHDQPAGTFSDDTSMMLATCDSIRSRRGRIDCDDMCRRFCDWAHRGRYAVDGIVFDIGSTVVTALAEGKGRSHERSNGNGSLMRIAPLAFTDATDDEVRAVSAITHAHETSTGACVAFVRIMRALIERMSLEEALADAVTRSPGDALSDAVWGVWRCHADNVRSGGYVLDTLGAAIWCVSGADTYEEAVLNAVNLGGDTDTTACVAGALAGVMFGYDAIPTSWIDTLRGRDIIESCLF